MEAPTATELRATLVTLLAGATDTPPRKWEKAIGAVEMLSIVFNPRSNWRVDVRAGAAEDRDHRTRDRAFARRPALCAIGARPRRFDAGAGWS